MWTFATLPAPARRAVPLLADERVPTGTNAHRPARVCGAGGLLVRWSTQLAARATFQCSVKWWHRSPGAPWAFGPFQFQPLFLALQHEPARGPSVTAAVGNGEVMRPAVPPTG